LQGITLSQDTLAALAIAGVVIGVVGIGLAAVFYIRGKRDKRPTYCTRSVNIVKDLGSRVGPVTMSYDGASIATLTVTKLAFWNAGREAIDRSDISEDDPLFISVVDGVSLLQVDEIASNAQANAFEISQGEKPETRRIEFGYLNGGAGGVFQVMHTGADGSVVSLVGSLRDVHRIRRVEASLGYWANEGVATLLVGAAFLGAAFLAKYLPWPGWVRVAVAFILATGVLLLGGRWFMQRVNRRVPADLHDSFRADI
jgi:hypothetical protein